MTKRGLGAKQIHCHKMIYATAVEMAGALYDEMMHDNLWYDLWKKQNPGASSSTMQARFIKRNLAKIIPQARATLAGMLAQPIDEALKKDIFDALILDNQLVRGRKNPPRLVQ